MKRVILVLIKLIFGLVLFIVSAVFVVLLVLGLWFINLDDYRKNEIKSPPISEHTDEDKVNGTKVNVFKLPADDQQELKNSKVIKRTISKDDGKILQGIKYLDFAEKVLAEMDMVPHQPICQIICDTSSLDQERLVNDPYLYLEKFYVQNKNRALEDFYFRHKLESTKVVTVALTLTMREMYVQGLQIDKKNILEQTAYVAKFQFATAQVLYNISQLKEKFKNYEENMSQLLELRKTCEYTSAKAVQQNCFDILQPVE
jgi:hypothetical protein